MKREKRGGRETSPFFLSVAVKCYVSSFALRDLQIRIRGKRRIQSRVQDVERTERLGVQKFWLARGRAEPATIPGETMSSVFCRNT